LYSLDRSRTQAGATPKAARDRPFYRRHRKIAVAMGDAAAGRAISRV
jgi:hypothetical protein